MLQIKRAAFRALHPRPALAVFADQAFAKVRLVAERTIDAHERRFRPTARGVQDFSDRAFARAIFADEQDRGANGREFFDLRDELGEFDALADQPALDVGALRADPATGR